MAKGMNRTISRLLLLSGLLLGFYIAFKAMTHESRTEFNESIRESQEIEQRKLENSKSKR